MATDENIGTLLLENLSESGQALGPLMAVIAMVFLIFFRDCPKEVLWRMAKGIIIAAIGLTIFLMGVWVGFVPYAQEMGFLLATEHSPAFLIAVGFAIGLTATLAEPGAHLGTR